MLVKSPSATAGICPDEGSSPPNKEVIRSVRITFFDAEAGPASQQTFICDRMIAADETGDVFYLDTAKSTVLDIHVEAYGEPAQPGDATPLISSGRLDRVSFSGYSDIPRVFMANTNEIGCSLGAMHRARAFHTATPLPGGRALITGGVVATNGEVTAVAVGTGLLLTSLIEIYDSRTGSFIQPDLAGEPGIPRAFHSAFLVTGSTADVAQVLLLGGVGQGEVPEGSGVVKIPMGPEHPFRMTPDPQSAPAEAMLLTVDFTVDPPLVTRSTDGLLGWPAAFFQGSAVYGPNGACIVGGAEAIDGNGAFSTTISIDLGLPDSAGHYPVPANLIIPRIGSTVTTSADGSVALIWGGNLNQPDPSLNIAERLIIDPAPPLSSILTLDASASTGATPISTAFHTATLLPGGDVLIVGGFVVEPLSNLALNPDLDNPLTVVRYQGNQFEFHPQTSGVFMPVGYHAALALGDGRVLITGGSPYYVPGVTPCPTPGAESAWTCSTNQALIYTPGASPSDGGALDVHPAGALQMPRFGHTMSRLTNRTVLIAGGLRRDSGELYTEPSAEVWNLADGSAAQDNPLHREPGTTLSATSICPVY
ncbi:MAG: hypothetical protein JRI25_21680 [Deltaproteobacteria bacterium]|nr:hypothetical protein [Deltaproteobacteria bacterium]